ncbi:MAG: dihydropteroate synthase [Gammaproteobacteria bacterium]|nr:MAG: dihydropteroate synthase [Gammaproteobacteria bacterium]
MGILNVTQDSFSDGGLFVDSDKAKQQAKLMVEEGASIIDVGGESTRPGAKPISADEELARVIPVIEYITQLNIPVSIDTNKASVMEAAVKAGASMINDVCALQNPGALEAASKLQVPICLMHMQGSPQTMQDKPHYDDVVVDIIQFFKQRIEACTATGIDASLLVLDPGFGFGKTLEHNLNMLSRLQEFNVLNCPLLVGMSRKSMIGQTINKPADKRVSASVALAILAWQKGASLIRVHDVQQTKDALDMVMAVNSSTNSFESNP